MPGLDPVAEIREILGAKHRSITLMEVCGTHTMAIARAGIKRILPSKIKLVSGPGCPVCVTPVEVIDYACRLAADERNIVVSFGDMVRVPGSRGVLENFHHKVVYSPRDALSVARNNPDRNVIFIAVGFETTAPAIAATVIEARRFRIENFYILPALKTIPPALGYLARRLQKRVDGFILPGHVSAIIGEKPYRSIARDYGLPGCITGFEPAEIIRGIHNLTRQIASGRSRIANEYRWVVRPNGNPEARRLLNRVFKPVSSRWRGIGVIPLSGLNLKKKYEMYDARRRFKIMISKVKEPRGCICAQILLGLREPSACVRFGRECTPASPIGACMVSSEGTCAAAYKYGVHSA
jgi:hydrogenase expression/formation protein HypD